MGLSRRLFTNEFKLAPCAGWSKGSGWSKWCGRLEVSPNVLHRWHREFRPWAWERVSGQWKERWSEGRIAELERNVGQQALGIDF